MRILLIDDDTNILSVLKVILESNGHIVDCADSADDALDLVSEYDYDFVLVDFKMPTHDGAWFLRNAHLRRNTKALLMTAFLTPNVVNTMFMCGASGYIMKPLEQQEVLQHLAFHTGC
ncbi:MAG: response regulator [Lentisphaerales bacterium]|jgi:DNA-binding response OmpR family regulator|nr:MAG: response regulator [Lentisphaerales bacterium]